MSRFPFLVYRIGTVEELKPLSTNEGRETPQRNITYHETRHGPVTTRGCY